MYPPAFDYHVPTGLPEAVALLGTLGPDAKVLAGGCSLIPMMKLRLAEPPHLVDLRHIDALRGIRVEAGELVIGAMSREADLAASPEVRQLAPLLVETSEVIADPLVRNMGTIGGNVAHADPANDHPAAMLALGATFALEGPAGRRLVAADDFFVDLYETALSHDEVLTEIRVPLAAAGSGSAYVKVERQVGDFAIVGAAVHVTVSAGSLTSARIALTNTAGTALRARTSEEMLIGEVPDADRLAAAADEATRGLEPWDELRGSAAYKLRLVPVTVRRALGAAIERAGGGHV